MGLDPNLLRVSEDDIQQCYMLAGRVGNKWAEVLQREGYIEFANIACDVVRKGRFLEPPTPSPASSIVDADNERSQIKASKYVSPYTALHTLRRYAPDCDGSGLPSKYLPITDCKDNEHNIGKTSAREVIQQIDEMARNGQTNWHHGWDAIEEAVERNKKRMESSRSRASIGVDEYEIVPRQDFAAGLMEGDGDDEDDADHETQSSKKRGRSPETEKTVQFKSEGDMVQEGSADVGRMADDIDFLSSANKKAKRILKRRRRGQEEVASRTKTSIDDRPDFMDSGPDFKGVEKYDGKPENAEKGRTASSIGVEVFSWEGMLNSMSMDERRKLIVSAIHPPYPFESDMNDRDLAAEGDKPAEYLSEEDVPPNAIICGALKEIGHTHLWEQTRHLPEMGNSDEAEDKEGDWEQNIQAVKGEEIIYGASEARASFQSQQLLALQKKALKRATKERLGRRTISTNGIMGEYAKAFCSKVKWTEDVTRVGKEDFTARGALAADSSLLQNEASGQQERNWLEMDLGECMVELDDDNEQTDAGKGDGKQNEKTKRFLSFRSLELALNY